MNPLNMTAQAAGADVGATRELVRRAKRPVFAAPARATVVPHRGRALAIVVVISILASTTEAAERWAVRSMTKILMTFEHAPGCADRSVLRQILNDEETTPDERVVATALLNVHHIPQAADKQKLEALIIDPSTPSSLRALATAIVNLTHTITETDRAALEPLLK